MIDYQLCLKEAGDALKASDFGRALALYDKVCKYNIDTAQQLHIQLEQHREIAEQNKDFAEQHTAIANELHLQLELRNLAAAKISAFCGDIMSQPDYHWAIYYYDKAAYLLSKENWDVRAEYLFSKEKCAVKKEYVPFDENIKLERFYLNKLNELRKKSTDYWGNRDTQQKHVK